MEGTGIPFSGVKTMLKDTDKKQVHCGKGDRLHHELQSLLPFKEGILLTRIEAQQQLMPEAGLK